MTPGNCSLMVRISKICLKFIFILVNFEKSTKKNIRQFLILCNNNRRENAHMIEQQLKVFTAEAPWMHMILTFLKIANFQKSNTLRSLNKLLSFLSCCLGHHTIFYKKIFRYSTKTFVKMRPKIHHNKRQILTKVLLILANILEQKAKQYTLFFICRW